MSESIAVPGATLRAFVAGEGVPLLVLHGGPGLGSGYLRGPLAAALAPGYRLLFYDMRGSGHSSGAEDETRLTMDTFVADALAACDHFGLERANVVGHSFGGLLALHTALAHPERVASLILIDPDPATEPEWARHRAVVDARLTADDREALEAIRSTPGFENDPRAVEHFLRIIFRTYVGDREHAARLVLGLDSHVLANHARTSVRIRESLGAWDVRERLGAIRCPTLIVHGAASIFRRESAEELRARIPGSRLEVLEGVGHFPETEAPERLARVVRSFLPPAPSSG